MKVTELPSSEEAPKIEFPCDYPIKVMGLAAPDYKQAVLDIIQVHAPDLDYERVELRESRTGKYYSVTVTIVATGEAQLSAIFEDLKASGRVNMVL